MNILVFGGTRFIGKNLVEELLINHHQVTIATRGITKDNYGDKVQRIHLDRKSSEELKDKLSNQHFDVVYDSLAYCSNDVKVLLDVISCDKYIMISSTATYHLHSDTKEDDFDPYTNKLVWCNREDFCYDEVKRQAECALFQEYPHINAIAVRFPFVIGEDDYTKRLFFYIEHIVKQIPMNIDNYDNQMSFVNSKEAGRFLVYLATTDYKGSINGANPETISIKEVVEYVVSKGYLNPILSNNGEEAPYNGAPTYSINIEKASKLGFTFSPLKTWIFKLIDTYIKDIKES